MPAEIKVMSAGAVESMVKALGAEFERATGYKLDLAFNTAGNLRARFENGETADLVILPQASIAAYEKHGLLVPGSVKDLGRTVTGVAVREGPAVPDISTPEAFKQALLKARGVAYSDPKAGGSIPQLLRQVCSTSSALPRTWRERIPRPARLRSDPGGGRRPLPRSAPPSSVKC